MTPSSRALRDAGRIPTLGGWDSTLALRADPYRFIARRCAELDTDVFRTRLLLRPALCLSGEAAAALFYDPERFEREGAAPEALRATLFGQGTVQSLDGAAHHARKALFMASTTPGAIDTLVGRVRTAWEQAVPAWTRAGSFSLYRAMQPILTRGVLSSSGLPRNEPDLPARTRELVALFDAAAGGPLAHLQARLARRRLEEQLAGWIEDLRAGRIDAEPEQAVWQVARHVGADGLPLPARVAAAELLNLLRPTVAVAVWITFVAHALHAQPRWAAALRSDPYGAQARAFVQEVRRHYPFFPAVVARVRVPFEWRGLHFPQGVRALLDIHGTNHDPRAWHDAQSFRPERWIGVPQRGSAFIAQGGGDVATQHRCPGEDVALRLMLLAVEMLTGRLRYDVVRPQDLRLDMRRLPALPRDGMRIDRVALAGGRR